MSEFDHSVPANPGRRDVLALGVGAAALMLASALPFPSVAASGAPSPTIGDATMSHVTTKDGVDIFYKD